MANQASFREADGSAEPLQNGGANGSSPQTSAAMLRASSAAERAALIQAQAALVSAEYAALRGEIGRYQDHQRQLMNSVFLVIGGSITLAGPIGSSSTAPLIPVRYLLLCVPPLYALLALLYLDRAVRIIRLAHYLHHRARASAASIVRCDLWEWETYKGETKVVPRRVAFFLDRLRWAIFVIPICMTSILLMWGLTGTTEMYRNTVLGIGLGSLALTLAAALLTEETSGVASKPQAPKGAVPSPNGKGLFRLPWR
jgi:hypothetical protein